jgi:hypothetical protein
MRRIIACVFISGVLGFLLAVPVYAASDVKFKILAVNPSESQSLKTMISQPLPAEVNPAKDIIEKAGLEVRFDPDSKVYVLTGEVDLKPHETKTFEVRVRDVWQVTSEETDATKKDLEEQINGLKGTKYFDTAQLLYEKAQEGIDRILEEQGKPVGMKQHIELYRAHIQQLQEIKSSGISLAAMRKLEDENKQGIPVARLLLTAENPSSEPKMMTVRSMLPREITANDVIDKQGFDLLYDQTQKAYALEKQEQFAAKESKKFIIKVKDVWRISDQDIKFTKDQTEKLVALLKDSPFGKYAATQGAAILDILAGITKLQTELESSMVLEDRMRAFVLDSEQMRVAKAKLNNIMQLVSDAGLKKDDAIIAEKIRDFVKKLADMKDIVLMAMGLKPNTPATWWIIFGIIVFLAIVSTGFYLTMLKQLQKNKFAPKKGTQEAENNASQAPPPEEKNQQ